MTRTEMEQQVSELLLEQRRLKRLGLELGPAALSLLSRLLYRLGLNRMSRTPVARFAKKPGRGAAPLYTFKVEPHQGRFKMTIIRRRNQVGWPVFSSNHVSQEEANGAGRETAQTMNRWAVTLASKAKKLARPVQYARLTLSQPRPWRSPLGKDGFEHDYHDESGTKLGVLQGRYYPDEKRVHVHYVGPEGAEAGSPEHANTVGTSIRELGPELARHYPEAESVSGYRAGGFRKGQEEGIVKVPINRIKRMERSPLVVSYDSNAETKSHDVPVKAPSVLDKPQSRVDEDLHLFRTQVRSKHVLAGQKGVRPNTPEEHALLHDFARTRGLKVRQGHTRYEASTHTLYYPVPENKAGVGKAYKELGTLKMARKGLPRRMAKIDGHQPSHPMVQGFPIETALRHLANDPKNGTNIRDTARHVLTTGDSSGLFGLNDALQDPGEHDYGNHHPMARAYNWMSAADKLHLDRHTYRALEEEAERTRYHTPHQEHRFTAPGGYPGPFRFHYSPEGHAQRAAAQLNDPTTAPPSMHGSNEELLNRVRARTQQLAPHATPEMIDESIRRHGARAAIGIHSKIKGWTTTGTPEETHPFQQRAIAPFKPGGKGQDPGTTKNELAARYARNRSRSVTGPVKYAKVLPSEQGVLTPEQLQIARRAHDTGDRTAWAALGDHLQDSGFPNAGTTLSLVGTATSNENIGLHPHTYPGHESLPEGWFRYAHIRDGANLVHYLRMKVNGQMIAAWHRHNYLKMARKLPVRYATVNRSDFLDALRRLQSSNHTALTKAATDVAQKMGVTDSKVLPALHDTPHGSVPGVAQAIYGPTPPEQVHALASWVNGLLPNGPGYAVFHPRPTGPDTLYRIRQDGSGMDTRARLDRAGIRSRVLVPHRKGFDILVPDKGNKLARNVEAYTTTHGLPVEASPGHFQLVGSGDQARAREMFRGNVVRAEQKMSRTQDLVIRLAYRTVLRNPKRYAILPPTKPGTVNNRDQIHKAILAHPGSKKYFTPESLAKMNPGMVDEVARQLGIPTGPAPQQPKPVPSTPTPPRLSQLPPRQVQLPTRTPPQLPSWYKGGSGGMDRGQLERARVWAGRHAATHAGRFAQFLGTDRATAQRVLHKAILDTAKSVLGNNEGRSNRYNVGNTGKRVKITVPKRVFGRNRGGVVKYAQPLPDLSGGPVPMTPRFTPNESDPQDRIRTGLEASRRQTRGQGYVQDATAGKVLADALDEAGEPHGVFFRNLVPESYSGLRASDTTSGNYKPIIPGTSHPVSAHIDEGNRTHWFIRPTSSDNGPPGVFVHRDVDGPRTITHSALLHAPALREWAAHPKVSPALRAHLINAAEHLEAQEPKKLSRSGSVRRFSKCL